MAQLDKTKAARFDAAMPPPGVATALRTTQEWDTTQHPVIVGMSSSAGWGDGYTNDYTQTGGTFNLTFKMGGAGCTASSTVTVFCGGQAANSITVTENQVVATFADMGDWTAVPAGNTIVPIYLRVDGQLCPIVCMPPTVS
jgi:hypothetical protein